MSSRGLIELSTISNDCTYRFLKDIAECVDQLLHHTYGSPGLPFFQKQYFALLEQHGFITINGCLRVVEFLNRQGRNAD